MKVKLNDELILEKLNALEHKVFKLQAYVKVLLENSNLSVKKMVELNDFINNRV